MTRLRRVALLAGFTIVALLLVAVAVFDPFHWRNAPWFVAGTVTLAILLATWTIVALVPVRLLRVFLGVLGLVVAAGWVATSLLLVSWNATTDVSTVESADGARRIVVVRGGGIDPQYEVVVRTGGDLFEQETLLWQGLPEGAAPTVLEWVDPYQVRVEAGGCTYVSQLEPMTFEVDPVHRQESLGGC